MSCPFCGAPVAQKDGDAEHYECNTMTDKATGGDSERTRTHQCYMNQIKQLQTGETNYGQGFQDGVRAMRQIMEEATRSRSKYLLLNPPTRRSGYRHLEDEI